jgi:hypothetical protein
LIAIHHEPRCFIGAIGVNDAAHLDAFFFSPHLQALICNNADCAPANAGIRGHDCFAVIGFIFVD